MIKSIGRFLKPARTIPHVPWRAPHQWHFEWRRTSILFFGLFIFGLGDSLLIQSKFGNAPWSVLAQGIHLHSPLTIGAATFLIGAVVLLLWIPFKQKPGFGTLANIAIISGAIQIGIWNFPELPVNGAIAPKVAYVLSGIALVGIGSSLYITCGLGSGPRDGLMTAIHHKTGVRVGRVRLFIELCALAIGWALGGSLGIGTALFALLIGNSVAISFGVMDRVVTKRSQ